MPTVSLTYQGSLRTEAVHEKSNNVLLTDAPTDNHGKGETFSPTDLVATAMISCMVTVMGILARKRNMNMGNVSSSVEKIMVNSPRRIGGMNIIITLSNHRLSMNERHLLEQTALNCPVAKSIHPDIQTHVKFVYN